MQIIRTPIRTEWETGQHPFDPKPNSQYHAVRLNGWSPILQMDHHSLTKRRDRFHLSSGPDIDPGGQTDPFLRNLGSHVSGRVGVPIEKRESGTRIFSRLMRPVVDV